MLSVKNSIVNTFVFHGVNFNRLKSPIRLTAQLYTGSEVSSLVVLVAWPWPRGSSRTPFGGLGLRWPGLGLDLEEKVTALALDQCQGQQCNSRNEKIERRQNKQKTNIRHDYYCVT